MTDLRIDELPVPAPVAPSELPPCAPDNPLEALEWLGGTVEEVAEGLRARGIKGRVGDGASCPLANYLSVWWRVGAVFKDISIYPKGDYDYGNGITVVTPPVCLEFINQFDENKFPDLIG